MRQIYPTEQTANYGETETQTQAVKVSEVRAYVERMERLVEQRAAVNSDMSSLREEIKSAGYDAKAIGEVVKIRAQEPKKKAEYQMVETYANALDIDLFSAAPLPGADEAGSDTVSADDASGRWS